MAGWGEGSSAPTYVFTDSKRLREEAELYTSVGRFELHFHSFWVTLAFDLLVWWDQWLVMQSEINATFEVHFFSSWMEAAN